MMKSFLITTLFLGTSALHALEIDEKLTLRFLKVSNSKKTVLINRGAEDGLVVGDHAKFFITSGVVARGIVEKVSPSRSIWSLYRVVDPAEIIDGKVLNLKIASPVKITEDPSKSLKEEPIPGGPDKMNMNEDTEVPVLDEADKKELEGLGIEEDKPQKSSSKKEGKKNEVSAISTEDIAVESVGTAKNWELWASINMNALTGTTTSSETGTEESFDAVSSDLGLSAGVERYFSNSDSEFWKNFSVQGLVRSRTYKYETSPASNSIQNILLSRQYFEYGGGGSYHFFNPPNAVNSFIGYGNISAGMGKITQNNEIQGATTTTADLTGTDTFFSVGIGSKYFLSNGLGLRALLEYYTVSESYDVPASGTVENFTMTRTLKGARLEFGLSYRF